MMENLKEKLGRIESWWKGEWKGRPLFKKTLPFRHNDLSSVFDVRWENEKEIPDFRSCVTLNRYREKLSYLGEAYPFAPHVWGARGTPEVMAAYMGGNVVFREDTVWVEPIAGNLEDFPMEFREDNHWVRMSRSLMERQLEEWDGTYLVSLPVFGDALTCFSLMRGAENLIFDMVEKPGAVLDKILEFTEAWKNAHKYFHRMYSSILPGDSDWLIWAPGKLCTCECDFSTMISPAMFEKFVVYELELMKEYSEYFIWHLDGYEEVRHLDILLGLPYIKAIQVAPPPAGKPPCASDRWLPVIRKITESGRMAYVYANNPGEFEILAKKLPAERLFIDGGVPGESEEEALSFIENLMKNI